MLDRVNAMVFVDYYNLSADSQRGGLLDLVTDILSRVPLDRSARHCACELRLYGGWYEGDTMTRDAQSLAVSLQDDFPATRTIAVNGASKLNVMITAELATSMLLEPGTHLFGTFRRKGRPRNIRVKEQSEVGCSDEACALPKLRQLLKAGCCPTPGCAVEGGDFVYRHEQKLVDTMLACDMVHASTNGTHLVILVSGDDDFLPPLRTALRNDRTVVRVLPSPNSRPTEDLPRAHGFIEIGL